MARGEDLVLDHAPKPIHLETRIETFLRNDPDSENGKPQNLSIQKLGLKLEFDELFELWVNDPKTYPFRNQD